MTDYMYCTEYSLGVYLLNTFFFTNINAVVRFTGLIHKYKYEFGEKNIYLVEKSFKKAIKGTKLLFL